MNVATSADVNASANFCTRASFSSEVRTVRTLAYGLPSAFSSTRASLAGLRPPSIA